LYRHGRGRILVIFRLRAVQLRCQTNTCGAPLKMTVFKEFEAMWPSALLLILLLLQGNLHSSPHRFLIGDVHDSTCFAGFEKVNDVSYPRRTSAQLNP